jgi:ATP-binding cassette subfamily B protein
MTSASKSLPSAWHMELHKRLADAEEILAWMEIDLDSSLHFTRELLLVTNKRIASLSLTT